MIALARDPQSFEGALKLYAIGVYLLAEEPAKNPNAAPREILDRGEQIFRREGCINCHLPPAYTTGS